MKNFTLKILRDVIIVAFFTGSIIANAQTSLTAGDLVITGFNSDGGDQFSFVLLTDITATTQINFTDNGWQSSGSFRNTEGVLTWTADEALTCGTEVIIFRSSDSNPFSATLGNVASSSGSFVLSTAGDQVTAFQGTVAAPTLLYIVNFNSLSWTDATNSNNTALPAGLTDGFTAVSTGNTDNGHYDCSVESDVSALLTAVSTPGNWIKNNSAQVDLGTCNYFCSSDAVDWCNLQWPDVGNIPLGNAFNVYARVYEPGVTPGIGAGAGITAWIGFSTVDASTTSDFSSDDWTWVPATFNLDAGNDDEYIADIGPYIPANGVYYFVSRFQYNSGPYTYGGYSPAPGGGFWDGTTYVSNIVTVNSTCATTTTWDGTTWDNGAPILTSEAILNGNYDSTALPSFTACSLTINPGFTLTIDNSKYVEVYNDIVIDGDLIVRTDGSLVQVNDAATVTGTATIEKSTAILNNWYEYTYWSSPVANETIANGLAESDSNRRFWFNASNFVDSMAETNNDNNLVSGQDDIDDNANDWQYASGATVMAPGVGYAATHDQVGFIGPGFSYTYSFQGTPNNGIVMVPVARNDSELNDINWNFIGNPYPSAIDIDKFFDENGFDAITNTVGLMEGAVYLWSQNTLPQNTNNGNETYNFSASDYAIINKTGETAGGDGITPARYIPSGQGFFIAYTNSTIPTSGNVEFNNSMRVIANNTQFFRTTNTNQPNKLSINLTSNNGVFNQALIGYVDGATNGYDGMLFDAPRNLSSGTAAIIYSTIENHSRKFAIQGKNPESLNIDEVINLGFKNTIDAETQFSIGINQIQGDFMVNNPVFVKDNYINIEHDLTQSDYVFTSVRGEFNDRFEIRFVSTLSLQEEQLTANKLLIVDAENDSWEISTTQLSEINNIAIFDLLGRQVLDMQSHNMTKVVVNNNNFDDSVYIVKVELANGILITKKVLKQ